MVTITPELIETVEGKIRKEIKHQQQKISCLHQLEPLAGKYVTKRIEPELKALFPDYKSVYLHKDPYCKKIELVLSNPGLDFWYEAFHFSITDDSRRVDADLIKKQIEDAEKEVKRLEEIHNNFRDQAIKLGNLLSFLKSVGTSVYDALTIADRNDNSYEIRRIKELCDKVRWL